MRRRHSSQYVVIVNFSSTTDALFLVSCIVSCIFLFCRSSLLEAQYLDLYSEHNCNTYPDTNARQKALCKSSPATLVLVSIALRMSLEECQAQFNGERWNCSMDSFKAFASKGTRMNAKLLYNDECSLNSTEINHCKQYNLHVDETTAIHAFKAIGLLTYATRPTIRYKK